MRELFRHITVTYLAPIVLVALFCLVTTITRIVPSTPGLATAYSGETSSYDWVNKVGPAAGFLLGSSTMRYGVSSAALRSGDSVWINFAMDARDPVVSYLLLEKYWPVKKPRTIIIGLDPWMYGKKYYKYRDRIMYLDFTSDQAWQYRKEDGNVIFSKATEYLQYNLWSPGAQTVHVDTIPDDLGSVKLTRTAVNFTNVKEDVFELGKYGWSDIQFSYLGKIKQYCDDHNVRAVFVITPKRADYLAWTSSHFAEEHRQWWANINKEIGDAAFINAMAVLSSFNQDSIFAEPYHLNQAGQVIFSHYLRSQINNPDTVRPGINLF